jgi:hypothetical protein
MVHVEVTRDTLTGKKWNSFFIRFPQNKKTPEKCTRLAKKKNEKITTP